MLNEKGSALIFTLLVILVLTVLATAVLEVTITNYRVSKAYADSSSAAYASEAGLEIAKSEFNEALLSDIAQRAQLIIYNADPKVPKDFLYKSVYYFVQNYLDNAVFSKYPKTGYLGDVGQKYTVNMYMDSGYQRLIYTIHIYSEGEYKNIKREGYAKLILNLESANPLTVAEWEIK
ncbi:PilX N-terminal domain-containing pilus assembly protein [Caldanaerobacter sp.]|uniref:PilX N-terminal domain-containing pilus assembly protein n=1 Tax=Caldanaerobacter sp. TaxID=2930036 RepID=UPI003C75B719